jgi:hydrogenase maturation protein HypF
VSPLSRWKIRVVGTVQGVGFRPFVARLARDLSLSGSVKNTSSAVEVEIEGSLANLVHFRKRLEADAPAAATLEHVDVEEAPVRGTSGFRIDASEWRPSPGAALPADLAICADCCREMDDPVDRRYRYAFLNCTACGPRYTIVDGLPYDRPKTAMRNFTLCAACQSDYNDPEDRRYHAEPIACPACGPRLEFLDGPNSQHTLALEAAVEQIVAGRILAIRGIGGFHLACNARDPQAVQELRQRKARGTQPFALMVRDVAAAREFVIVGEQEAALLRSSPAPIVLLPKIPACPLGESLAPGNGYLGVMLAYSPLHRLLLSTNSGLDALVMTSGNRHGEPIVADTQQAREQLASLADAFLSHNREILAACDDSVVRLFRGRPLAIRRARGYAPLFLNLPEEAPPAVAAGADLKSALGLSQGRRAIIGPHLGDMENLETLAAFEKNLLHLTRLYSIHPQMVFHDAHPDYFSTQWALRQAAANGWTPVAIQHHRAHAAAVLAEYQIPADERVLAIVFDGTGYGDDGAIWGGEFFLGPLAELRRCFHLPYVKLPGGDACARIPALAAIAHLHAFGLDWHNTAAAQALTPQQVQIVSQQLAQNWQCHESSSMGRLFDAAASLLGIRHRISYEAQAAIEMEALAERHHAEEAYGAAPWDLSGLWQEMLQDAHAPQERRANAFIGSIAAWSAQTALRLIADFPQTPVVLCGGVFQNLMLLDRLSRALEAEGIRVLVPRYLPPNDAALALGQIYLGTQICTKK